VLILNKNIPAWSRSGIVVCTEAPNNLRTKKENNLWKRVLFTQKPYSFSSKIEGLRYLDFLSTPACWPSPP